MLPTPRQYKFLETGGVLVQHAFKFSTAATCTTHYSLTFVREKHRDTLPLSVLSSLVKGAVSIGVGEVGVSAILQELLQQGDVVVKYGLGHDIRGVRSLRSAHLVTLLLVLPTLGSSSLQTVSANSKRTQTQYS